MAVNATRPSYPIPPLGENNLPDALIASRPSRQYHHCLGKEWVRCGR